MCLQTFKNSKNDNNNHNQTIDEDDIDIKKIIYTITVIEYKKINELNSLFYL